MFLGTELKSDAEAVGVLNHNALNKHFTFSTNKLYLKDVQIKDGAKKVSITEFSTNKDQFEKKIKVAIERTFENLSVKEMADTYAGWTWLNTVKVNEDHLVVSYSIKESLHTFMIVVGVVILVIIVIAILIACPDCVGLLFLFFD
jgi:subtilase family serine protease